MKQLFVILWITGMFGLVAYGWSDSLTQQAFQVVHFVKQVVTVII